MSGRDGKYQRHTTVWGTQCAEAGCEEQRWKGSIMCPRHTRRNRKRTRATTDGVLTGSKRKITDDDVVEMRRMRSQFKSTREIAEHFGVSSNTVLRYLKAAQS